MGKTDFTHEAKKKKKGQHSATWAELADFHIVISNVYHVYPPLTRYTVTLPKTNRSHLKNRPSPHPNKKKHTNSLQPSIFFQVGFLAFAVTLPGSLTVRP